MKYAIIFVITIALSTILFAQSPDCLKYRTGKFGYPDLPGKISLRKDSVQESYNDGKLEMLWEVKWISECKYQLTCVKLFNDKYPIGIGDRIVATIISTTENCFTAETIYYSNKYPNGVAMPPAPMCLVK
jgi:hypothetical protein